MMSYAERVSAYRMVDPVKPDEVVAEGCEITAESMGKGCTKRFILFRSGSHWMDWEVHESCGELLVNPPIPIFDDNPTTSPGNAREPTAFSMLISGFVKWDGCTQWSDSDQGHGWHYDRCDDVPDVKAIIRQVWRIASEKMTDWNNDVAGFEP